MVVYPSKLFIFPYCLAMCVASVTLQVVSLHLIPVYSSLRITSDIPQSQFPLRILYIIPLLTIILKCPSLEGEGTYPKWKLTFTPRMLLPHPILLLYLTEIDYGNFGGFTIR